MRQKRHAQELTEANCITRLSHAKKLLSKFPESAVDFIFFTDEKVFTVAPPVNLQNDRVYAPCGKKKSNIAADRLLRTRPTFSKSVIVSVEVSKLGCTELIFVEPGVKVAYYRDVLLSHDASCNPTSGRLCVRVPVGERAGQSCTCLSQVSAPGYT